MKRLNFVKLGFYFETGKSALKQASYAKLDEIVSIINEYPFYNLLLNGHTDNMGTYAHNLKFSQTRVDAAKACLIRKGVSEIRLEATGYGEGKPIATNKTALRPCTKQASRNGTILKLDQNYGKWTVLINRLKPLLILVDFFGVSAIYTSYREQVPNIFAVNSVSLEQGCSL